MSIFTTLNWIVNLDRSYTHLNIYVISILIVSLSRDTLKRVTIVTGTRWCLNFIKFSIGEFNKICSMRGCHDSCTLIKGACALPPVIFVISERNV